MQRFQNSDHFFNAHHSPVGAFASFTLGFPGAKGGLGLELGGPANESVFIGVQNSDDDGYQALPFFASSADSAKRYDVASEAALKQGLVQPFASGDITREFGPGHDTWTAGDLTFAIYSAPKAVPDPKTARKPAMQAAIVPAVYVELTIDNRGSDRPRKAFFGYEGSNPFYNTRRLDDVARGQYVGVGQGPVTAIVSDSPGVFSGVGFTLDQCIEPDFPENLGFGLGGVGVLMATIPARSKKSLRLAICFYRDGVVTSGLAARYFYTRYFASIEAVATYALGHWQEQKRLALKSDREVSRRGLSRAQEIQVSHAVRSYYGATEFLVTLDDKPFWAVNEGEYRMLNTFDLTVDHLFFEIDRNPWVVRNQLDWFVDRYAYTDTVRLPGDQTEYPGGLSFTHDMGIGNCLSRPGYSSYEKFGLSGCFSHMTHEQLVNWVCCATTYVLRTADKKWLESRLSIFKRCLKSLVNRDHPDPALRDGVMSTDSSRCLGGAEITTYDSLDVSLGQARNNLYLAVKTWAAYLGLQTIFEMTKQARRRDTAATQAHRCAETICANLEPEGFIPAVIKEGNKSRIIPAIEGLCFPRVWGFASSLDDGGEYGSLLRTLRTHFENVLIPGTCLFSDGGWKLSSTNDNSWLSKIYLCQFVARQVLGWQDDGRSDEAHLGWLLDPENSYFAWSDQMVAGKAHGSKYYPRGVTAWLWLTEKRKEKGSRKS